MDMGSVPSGQFTNVVSGSADEFTRGVVINREGIGNLKFPKGAAGLIPWGKIKRIEVLPNGYANFILYNGMVGRMGYNKEDIIRAHKKDVVDWFTELEGRLIMWSLQSDPLCQMPDGRVAYTLGVPKMYRLDLGEESIEELKQKLYNQTGQVGQVDTINSGEIFIYHEEMKEIANNMARRNTLLEKDVEYAI
jgi:hypothetical protein